MIPILMPLYGHFNINSYGVMIAAGLSLATRFMIRQKPASISAEQISHAVLAGIAGGIVGGRILFAITEPSAFDTFLEYFYPWLGGYSILGAVIGILASVFIYCTYAKISYPIFMDLVALNAGLLQGFARLGCFLAGCCGGMPTNSAFAINHHYPVQIYSAATYFLIFLIMQSTKKYSLPRGMRIAIYCALVGLERFIWDFLRDDRLYADWLPYFSITQWIALALFLSASALIMYLWRVRPRRADESF